LSKSEDSPTRTPLVARSQSAVIIAGAAAKGAYAAGALAEIAASGRFDVAAVVGASSGALNGAVYAAGLRVGRAEAAAEALCSLWAERANAWDIRSFARRKAILREALETFRREPTTAPIRFHVVVTSLTGRIAPHGHVLSEETHHFGPNDFADPARLDFMSEICVASAAIPFVFAPVWVNGRGPYWDGGVVNNTPVSLAIHGNQARGSRSSDVNHVIVVSPERSVVRPAAYSRFAFSRFLEILVEERLGRDLEEASSFNHKLDDLRTAIERIANRRVPLDELGPKLDWRLLDFTEIRPFETDLEGNFLSGFFKRAERQQHLALGREAAQQALASDATRAAPESSAATPELRLPN
jgi:predicted acylesterase/phospholipase RssA